MSDRKSVKGSKHIKNIFFLFDNNIIAQKLCKNYTAEKNINKEKGEKTEHTQKPIFFVSEL